MLVSRLSSIGNDGAIHSRRPDVIIVSDSNSIMSQCATPAERQAINMHTSADLLWWCRVQRAAQALPGI